MRGPLPVSDILIWDKGAEASAQGQAYGAL